MTDESLYERLGGVNAIARRRSRRDCRREHRSWVGTDGAEWWLGFDSISRIVRAQRIEV